MKFCILIWSYVSYNAGNYSNKSHLWEVSIWNSIGFYANVQLEIFYQNIK